MIPNDVLNKFRDGDTHIILKHDDRMPLSEKMLVFPFRDYVINKVKKPLQYAIESSKRIYQLMPAIIQAASQIRLKFGISKQNTNARNTHLLIDHKERFLSYELNKGRVPLLAAVYDLTIAENEHDLYYSPRMDVEIEFIIMDILLGKWQPRPEGYPNQYWKEPAPFGGKYSIVYKLQQHREEILKLIGVPDVGFNTKCKPD